MFKNVGSRPIYNTHNQDHKSHLGFALDKISIITVCYNEAPESIKYTLDSAIDQFYENKEIILVDGGSESLTLEKLKEYVAPNVRLLSEPDDGIYDAMNKGIDLATGDWLFFLNIRDRFSDSKVLERFIKHVEELPEKPDVAYGYVEKGKPKKRTAAPKIGLFFFFNETICHQAAFCSRSSFQKVGRFNTTYRIIADRDWFLRALKHKLQFKHLPLLVCVWESGGVCSDYRSVRSEKARYRAEHYSAPERFYMSAFLFLVKIGRRISHRNFKIPVRVRDILSDFRKGRAEQ